MMQTLPRRLAATLLAAYVGLQAVSPAQADAQPIKLARYPDYHAGKIVFSYLGDLWQANEDGSQPVRLTVHKSRSIMPRYSPDGKWIAFSSNRYGDYDVFVMPASGGTAKRLTYHSASDMVVGWARDSRRVVFSSPRGLLFPGIANLYEVPINGGIEQPLPTDWGYHGSYSPDGKKLAFNRHPFPWSRKHYRGSFAADLWVTDLTNKSYRRIVDDTLADELRPNNLWPMYRNGEIYFVSDREVTAKAGSPTVMTSKNNIWKVPEDGGKPTQVTHHASGSLFFPSMSSDGKVIVYEEGFGIWKLDLNSLRSTEIKVRIASDDKDNVVETITINSEADQYHLSPTGKRAVVASKGELFTIATDKGDVRRLTHTPSVRETSPQWSPDGKLVAFVSDQSGEEQVWVCDERGRNMRQVSEGDTLKGQLVWSPDSKSLLYTGSDKKLYRHDFSANRSRVVAEGKVVMFGGGAIGTPQWSPDGKWISFTRNDDNLLPHVYVIPSEGGQARRITDADSYSDVAAAWTPDGKKIVYLSGIDNENIGQVGRSTAQLRVFSLVPEEKDPNDRNIDSEEEAAKAEQRPPAPGLPRPQGQAGAATPPTGAARGPTTTTTAPKVDVKIDFNNLGRRTRQLTRVADSISSVTISPDSRTVVFTTTGTEGGRPVQSIWSIGMDGDRQTRLMQSTPAALEEEGPPRMPGGLGGFTSLQITKDGRSLYYRQGGGIYSVPMAASGGDGSSAASALTSALAGRSAPSSAAKRIGFTLKVEVDYRQQARQVFNEAWRVMKHRFYDPDMHGVNWQRMREVYEPLLEHVGDQEDLQNVISMMIGELNASHTGISGGGRDAAGSRNVTRFPGFEMADDKAAGYYKVTHIYKSGPADKDFVKLKQGDYILAIDDQPLKAGDNYWKLLASASGTRIEFTVGSKPTLEGSWKIKITPVSSVQQNNLQYERWVDERRQMTDKLSKGQVGYLHIRQMDDASLRQFERDLASLYGKKALVIDQRFNPGGRIDQELLQILQQRQYQYTKIRDSVDVQRPLRGFFGPMVVMANERSTSDAEVFPDGFRTLKLGKVVGVTTYGAVIGTGAYQMMDGSALRTPGSGLWNVNGTNLENYGVPPDVYVDNRPEDFLAGRDAQLTKAVQVLLEDLSRRKR